MQQNEEANLYGSLVISATTPCHQFPQLSDIRATTGCHTESSTKGVFTTLVTGSQHANATVALPQRNKYMNITVAGGSVGQSKRTADLLRVKLSDLDSRFDGARQLYKMGQLMSEIESDNLGAAYAAVINNTSEHATFTLLSQKIPFRFLGVFDTVNSSVRLVWTTDEQFIENVRQADPTRYVFYRYPMVYDRPLFIYTQSVASKWFQWNKVFAGKDGLLKAFNALEIFLFKDPSINSFER
jgi:hypothetical protein